ncbi:hypothetical protein ABT030_03045 [Streptomyces mirabilis]
MLDVRESQEQFERFAAERLVPGAKCKLGMGSDPVVEFAPLHRRFVAPE